MFWILLRTILTPLASLKLTVALMAASIVLIFAGTWAQIDKGIWTVLEEYFRTPLAIIPVGIFMPRNPELLENWAVLRALADLKIPWPGGYVLGPLLLVNLLAAHILRFKIKAAGTQLAFGLVALAISILIIVGFHASPLPGMIYLRLGDFGLIGAGFMFYAPLFISTAILFYQRSGIILIHAATLLLIAGEGVTAAAAEESMMPIYSGETITWSHDIREFELVVIDPDHPDAEPGEDRVVAISQAMLENAAADGEPIKHAELPFDIQVDQIMPNSTIFRVGENADANPLATRGMGLNLTVVENKPSAGVKGGGANMPAVTLKLFADGEELGSYLATVWFQYDQYKFTSQAVDVGDKQYQILLRFKRYYLPFAVRLIEFHHDLYPGTSIPKNFSSDIELIDRSRGIDQRKLIKMNQPLRYQGLTLFQADWIRGERGAGDRGTVLQVVRNPGSDIPYIACAIGGVGLLIHFVITLVNFLRKQLS